MERGWAIVSHLPKLTLRLEGARVEGTQGLLGGGGLPRRRALSYPPP
eukprot:COSAG05_NODE_963_length_6408_cov_4.077984_4_plen_47_part_00